MARRAEKLPWDVPLRPKLRRGDWMPRAAGEASALLSSVGQPASFGFCQRQPEDALALLDLNELLDADVALKSRYLE